MPDDAGLHIGAPLRLRPARHADNVLFGEDPSPAHLAAYMVAKVRSVAGESGSGLLTDDQVVHPSLPGISLLVDRVERSPADIVGRMPRNGHNSGLRRLDELAVASFYAVQGPTVVHDHPNDRADLNGYSETIALQDIKPHHPRAFY